MTKELSKQIMKRFESKNLYFKCPSKENFLDHKNDKTKCNNITKYAKKAYFQKVTRKSSKSFWNAVKPFFTNRGIITNDNITLEENRVLKNDPKKN